MKTETPPSTPFWHQFEQAQQESAILCQQWHEQLTPLLAQYQEDLAARDRADGAVPQLLNKVTRLRERENNLKVERLEKLQAKAEAERAAQLHERRIAGLSAKLAKGAQADLKIARDEITAADERVAEIDQELPTIAPLIAEAEAALRRAEVAKAQAEKAHAASEHNLLTIAGPRDVFEHVTPLLYVLRQIYKDRKIAELEAWADGIPHMYTTQLFYQTPVHRASSNFFEIFKGKINRFDTPSILLLRDVLAVIISEKPDFLPVLKMIIVQ